jgi:hypothetical protein
LDSRLGDCGTHVLDGLFFKNIWKIRKENSRLILRFNLRLGGYSIWSAIFITPHKKRRLKTTQRMSTS